MKLRDRFLEWWKSKVDWLLSKLNKPFKDFVSYVIAVARLIIWTILVFFSGLQRTLFMRSEVVGVDLKVSPLRSDMKDTGEKLAYIDKLCIENPDLAELSEEDYFDNEEDDFPFDDGGDRF